MEGTEGEDRLKKVMLQFIILTKSKEIDIQEILMCNQSTVLMFARRRKGRLE